MITVITAHFYSIYNINQSSLDTTITSFLFVTDFIEYYLRHCLKYLKYCLRQVIT